MNQKPKAVFCWSGGKDSSLALYRTIIEDRFEVTTLLTTLNQNHLRISMHGIREELLDMQAEALQLPLEKVWVKEGSNDEYEKLMEEKLLQLKTGGVTHVLFGDIFLEDLRTYRENNLSKIGLKAEFPLWNNDTSLLINEFLDLGFETITCCISSRHLTEDFVGKKIDANFILRLPREVDPCGENGEFHTFCYNGPVFSHKIEFRTGEKIFRPLSDFGVTGDDGFWFIDLLP